MLRHNAGWRGSWHQLEGQVRHSDPCPTSETSEKARMERRLDLRLSGDDTCTHTAHTHTLTENKDRCWSQCTKAQFKRLLDRRRSSSTFILITALIFSPASGYYHKSRTVAYLKSRAAVNNPGKHKNRDRRIISGGK